MICRVGSGLGRGDFGMCDPGTKSGTPVGDGVGTVEQVSSSSYSISSPLATLAFIEGVGKGGI